MPNLPDIGSGSILGDDPQKQVESVIRQVNEWGRAISNENRTRIMKSDSGIEAITIGQVPDSGTGIMLRDEDNVRRIIIGTLPDGTIGMVVSKEGYDVITDVFG